MAHVICCNLIVSVPGDWAGAGRDCKEQLDKSPPEVHRSVCQTLREYNSMCPEVSSYCKPEEKKSPDVKCEPARDNYNPGGESDEFNPFDCKNLQNVQIAILSDQVTASACGRVLLRQYADSREELNNIARRLRNNAPSKICCDRLSADELAGDEYPAGNSGFPNGEAGTDTYQDTDFYRAPDESTMEPFPPGMRIPDILPDTACADCKWELLKGDAKCRPQGRRAGLFWYEATWRCPKTGVEVFRASKQRVLQQRCR